MSFQKFFANSVMRLYVGLLLLVAIVGIVILIVCGPTWGILFSNAATFLVVIGFGFYAFYDWVRNR